MRRQEWHIGIRESQISSKSMDLPKLKVVRYLGMTPIRRIHSLFDLPKRNEDQCTNQTLMLIPEVEKSDSI